MIKNPFYNRQRITDPACFFGRRREIEVLYSAVITRQCRSLVGERKIGKSSLLTRIGQPHVMREYGLDPDRQLILYFDLEGMASASPADFWTEVLERLCSRVPGDLAIAVQQVMGAGEVRFMQVRRLLRRVRDAGFDLALCLDEFEALARGLRFESDFYGELRSLAGELGLVYLTASKRSLYELTYQHSDTLSSPFFNIFTELPLAVLEDAEADEMLAGLSSQQGRTAFCAEEILAAKTLAGTHPFFLQLAGFHLYELPGQGAPRAADLLQQVRKRFQAEAEDHYRYLWTQLTLTEQMALSNLDQASEREIRVLRTRNLVRERNHHPAPFSDTFAEFLHRQHTEQATVTGPTPSAHSLSFAAGRDLTGQTLGAYRIVSPIGRGGMAEVYKGYQPSLDRYVALKILSPHLAADAAFLERFQREATTVARLRHPNIVQVFDFGTSGSLTFMVMEYVAGASLKERLRGLPAGERVPCPEILAIARCVAAALDHAHAHGLVHRDVKPANILLRETSFATTQASGEPYAVLTDFGVAKMLEGVQVTAAGVTLGTPDYMSPEQAQGQETSPASDIYALGVVVFELLAGRLPFTSDTPVGVLFKHMTEAPPGLDALAPALPQEIDRVMHKALAKQPRQRFRTAGEFADALEKLF
jgi:serine/threonine-protein kinase